MIKVDQTMFGFPGGNCLSASLASLLEISIDDTPHFFMDPNDLRWWGQLAEWLKPRGFYPVLLKLGDEWKPSGLHLLSGKSPRGDFLHSVVADGEEIIHDPHPSRDGILSRVDVIVLVPTNPAVFNRITRKA